MKTYDELYYKQYEAGFMSENRTDHQRIIDLCNFRAEDKVLEIGCGYGVLLKKINCKSKFGTETNQHAVTRCREAGLNVTICNECVSRLSFENNSFDFVIMNEVIEHMQDPGAIVNEAYRILRQNGKIVITTTAKNALNKNTDQTHVSEMTIAELRCLLRNNDFKILTLEVSGHSVINFILNNLIFKMGRAFRDNLGTSASRLVSTIQDNYDKTVLGRLMSKFRPNFLAWGTTQLVIAKKNNIK